MNMIFYIVVILQALIIKASCHSISRVKNYYIPLEELGNDDTQVSAYQKTTMPYEPTENAYEDYDEDKDRNPEQDTEDDQNEEYFKIRTLPKYALRSTTGQPYYEYMEDTGWPTITRSIPATTAAIVKFKVFRDSDSPTTPRTTSYLLPSTQKYTNDRTFNTTSSDTSISTAVRNDSRTTSYWWPWPRKYINRIFYTASTISMFKPASVRNSSRTKSYKWSWPKKYNNRTFYTTTSTSSMFKPAPVRNSSRTKSYWWSWPQKYNSRIFYPTSTIPMYKPASMGNSTRTKRRLIYNVFKGVPRRGYDYNGRYGPRFTREPDLTHELRFLYAPSLTDALYHLSFTLNNTYNNTLPTDLQRDIINYIRERTSQQSYFDEMRNRHRFGTVFHGTLPCSLMEAIAGVYRTGPETHALLPLVHMPSFFKDFMRKLGHIETTDRVKLPVDLHNAVAKFIKERTKMEHFLYSSEFGPVFYGTLPCSLMEAWGDVLRGITTTKSTTTTTTTTTPTTTPTTTTTTTTTRTTPTTAKTKPHIHQVYAPSFEDAFRKLVQKLNPTFDGILPMDLVIAMNTVMIEGATSLHTPYNINGKVFDHIFPGTLPCSLMEAIADGIRGSTTTTKTKPHIHQVYAPSFEDAFRKLVQKLNPTFDGILPMDLVIAMNTVMIEGATSLHTPYNINGKVFDHIFPGTLPCSLMEAIADGIRGSTTTTKTKPHIHQVYAPSFEDAFRKLVQKLNPTFDGILPMDLVIAMNTVMIEGATSLHTPYNINGKVFDHIFPGTLPCSLMEAIADGIRGSTTTTTTTRTTTTRTTRSTTPDDRLYPGYWEEETFPTPPPVAPTSPTTPGTFPDLPFRNEISKKPPDYRMSANPLDADDARNWNCYTCGLTDPKFGNPECHRIFEQPDQRYRYQRRRLRSKCHGDPRYVGGCFVRYLDISVEYKERGCRAWPPLQGKSFASKRFARLERLLRFQEEGCVASPHAVLVPFSESVQLYARFHVCVCRGSFCNTAMPSKRFQYTTFVFSMTVLLLLRVF